MVTEVKLSIEPLYSWLAGKLLPSRHDLLSYAPQVMDQGYCNACTAFAVVTALSTYIMSTEGKRVTFDPFRLFFDSGGDCRNGNSLARVLEYVRLVGVKGSDGKVYKADPVPIHQRNINVYILNGIPVVTLLRVGKLSFTRYRRGVYNPFPLETKYNHALVILGFDDEREAYLCRNSMGRAWGEDGNVWIPYDYEFLATYAIAPIKTELPTSVDVSLHSLTGMGVLRITTDRKLIAKLGEKEYVILPPVGYIFIPFKHGVYMLHIFDERHKLVTSRVITVSIKIR